MFDCSGDCRNKLVHERISMMSSNDALEHAVNMIVNGSPKKAIILLNVASKLLQGQSEYGKKSTKVDILINYATAYEQLKEWGLAIANLKECLQILQNNDKELEHATSLEPEIVIRIAYLREYLDEDAKLRIDNWIDTAKECLTYLPSNAFSVAVLRAAYWLTTLSASEINDDQVYELHVLVEGLRESYLKGMTFNRLGLVHMNEGEFIKAADCFQRAYENLGKHGPKVKAIVLQNLGTAHAAAGRYELSVLALQDAIHQYRRVNFYTGEAQAACNLGYVWAACAEWSKSRWHYVLARRAAQRTDMVQIETQANEVISLIDQCTRGELSFDMTRLKVTLDSNAVPEQTTPVQDMQHLWQYMCAGKKPKSYSEALTKSKCKTKKHTGWRPKLEKRDLAKMSASDLTDELPYVYYHPTPEGDNQLVTRKKFIRESTPSRTSVDESISTADLPYRRITPRIISTLGLRTNRKTRKIPAKKESAATNPGTHFNTKTNRRRVTFKISADRRI
ncbi:unnamed protein product [Calicophoron daubneyi]|uniref:Tetratricopeptide repeat protein n=1 Tax=Calicophoron daubneyi TaxID=300641 RepID=A0AAV2TZ62_CALDB